MKQGYLQLKITHLLLNTLLPFKQQSLQLIIYFSQDPNRLDCNISLNKAKGLLTEQELLKQWIDIPLNRMETTKASHQQKLQIRIEGQGILYATCLFQLEKICQLPKIVHQLECQLQKCQHKSANQYNLVKPYLDNVVAKCNIELIYIEGYLGLLRIENIEVLFGKQFTQIVKPFIKLKVQNLQNITTPNKDGASLCRWPQSFQFEINKPESQLKIHVFDTGFISNDCIGVLKFSLLKQGLLQPHFQQQKYSGLMRNESKKVIGEIRFVWKFILLGRKHDGK